MKALHLFDNGKWTGPAEPALNLCAALRDAGVETHFACCPHTGASINKVAETARSRGLEPILRFYLSKHRHPLKNMWDIFALRRFIREEGFDLVHTHLDNGHCIAARATVGLNVPVVRSSYEGLGLSQTWRRRQLLARTAFLIEPGHTALEHDVRTYGYPRERTAVVSGAVDLGRFDPARETPAARPWLGVPDDAYVVGIVARLQRHRRYEDFWAAVRRTVDALPETRIIVVGRGTYQRSVGMEPVEAHGLGDHVHFAGFVEGDNYVGVLKAFDVNVFLVPGSDGTCRAVREAMAMGKPCVVSNRGMLPELVRHGEDGYVCDGSPDGLFGHLAELGRDAGVRSRMAANARQRALDEFSLEQQAQAVLAVYNSINQPSAAPAAIG